MTEQSPKGVSEPHLLVNEKQDAAVGSNKKDKVKATQQTIKSLYLICKE
jgi:hypothetical protein